MSDSLQLYGLYVARQAPLSMDSPGRLFATLWTVCSLPGSSVHGFSRHEYLSGLAFPPPGDLPDPRIEPTSLKSPALASGFFTTSAIWEAQAYGVGHD